MSQQNSQAHVQSEHKDRLRGMTLVLEKGQKHTAPWVPGYL